MTGSLALEGKAQELMQPVSSPQSVSSSQTTQIESRVVRLLEQRRRDGEESHVAHHLQANPSSQTTQLEPRVQRWLEEAAQLSCSLQTSSTSQKKKINLCIRKWLREQKEAGEAAPLACLLESILSAQKENTRPRDNSSSQKRAEEYMVRADDEPLDEIAATLTHASLSMPEARLVIRSRYVNMKELPKVYTIRRPRQAPGFESIFGVV